MESYIRNWKVTFFQGILISIFGLLAMGHPVITTVSLTLFIGVMFLISGVVGAYRAFTDCKESSFWTSIFSSLLFLIVGGLLITRPLAGMLTLTLIAAIYFAIEGIGKLYLAWQLREGGHFLWMAFGGVISLLLAFLVWSGWPETSTFVLGIMFGVNLLFNGAALIALALTGRSIEKQGAS